MRAHAKTLTQEDYERSRANVSWRHPYRDLCILEMSVLQGFRAVQTSLLSFKHVIDARGELSSTITAPACKRGEPHRMPLQPEAMAALRAHLAFSGIREGRLFRMDNGMPMSAAAVGAVLRRMYSAAGIIGASSHSGRRTLGTRAAMQSWRSGVSLGDVSRLLGHSSVRSTEPYVDARPIGHEVMKEMYPNQYSPEAAPQTGEK